MYIIILGTAKNPSYTDSFVGMDELSGWLAGWLFGVIFCVCSVFKQNIKSTNGNQSSSLKNSLSMYLIIFTEENREGSMERGPKK